MNGQLGLLHQAPIQSLEQRAAAGHNDPPVQNIRGQLRRRLLQRNPDRIHDGPHAFVEGLPDFLGGHIDRPGDVGYEIPPLNRRFQFVFQREGRADLTFDLFGGALAYEQVMRPSHKLHNGLVHLVAADLLGAMADDAGEGDYGDLRSPSSDVNHHRAHGLIHGKPHADSRRHGFRYEKDLSRSGALGRITHRSLLHPRDAGGHTDHDSGTNEKFVFLNLLDKIPEHLFRDLKIRNYSVPERTHGNNIAGRPPQHLFRLRAHSHYFTGVPIQGHNRGFVYHDPLSLHVHECVGRAQINAHIV